MPKLRVESFTLSLDGFGAGPDQDLNNPLGVGGGVHVIHEHRRDRRIDKMHIAIAPLFRESGRHA